MKHLISFFSEIPPKPPSYPRLTRFLTYLLACLTILLASLYLLRFIRDYTIGSPTDPLWPIYGPVNHRDEPSGSKAVGH